MAKIGDIYSPIYGYAGQMISRQQGND
jgi:hypothetical protein